MTYTPTDEQIEALAAHEFETATSCEWATARDVEQDDFRNWARESFGSPAFRSIIRAAQAEALRKWADDLEAVLVEDEGAGRIKDQIRARVLNPTMRLIVEQTRSEAAWIEDEPS